MKEAFVIYFARPFPQVHMESELTEFNTVYMVGYGNTRSCSTYCSLLCITTGSMSN